MSDQQSDPTDDIRAAAERLVRYFAHFDLENLDCENLDALLLARAYLTTLPELARLTTSNATLSSQYLVMAKQYAEVQAENRKLKAQLAALAP